MIRTASFAAVLLATCAPAFAQDAAAPAQGAPASAQQLQGPVAGATVYGPGDEQVGTIEKIDGDIAVVSTGTNRASIPLDRFGKGPKGPTIAVSKAQLDALAAQASAQASTNIKAQLVPGAQVKGSGGAVIASVKSATDQAVTLTTPEGKDVAVPVAAIAATDQGLTINMTAEQFNAAVAQAGQ